MSNLPDSNQTTSQRNADYLAGWRDALRTAVSVEITPEFAERAMPRAERMPEPGFISTVPSINHPDRE